MWLWIIIFVVLFTLSQFYKYNPWIFWSCVIVLIVLSGFRDLCVGIDTPNYKQGMTYVAMGISPYQEPGWNHLNQFIVNHGNDFNMLKLLVATLTIIPVAIVFIRISPNPQLSLFFYYGMFAYLNSFNGMRQFLAISFVLVAYMFFIERKYIFSLIFILIAYQFHHSAWYTLIVFALPFYKFSKDIWTYVILIATLVIGIVMNDSMVRSLTSSYSSYLDSSSLGYRGTSSIWFVWSLILSILLDALFVFVYLKTDYIKRNSIIFKIFFLSIIVNNLTFKLVLGARLILYFTIIQTILYPIYFNKRYQYTKWVILAYITVLFIKILLGSGGFYGGVYPYKSVISQYIYY